MPQPQPPRLGRIHLYTGDGVGKTTAVLGLALRAVGRGLRAAVIQFLKARPSGERLAAQRLQPDLCIFPVGRAAMVDPEKYSSPTTSPPHDADFDLASQLLHGGRYQVIVLDELCIAVAWGLLDLVDVVELLRRRPPGVEVVLTGRGAPAELCDLADYVTQMQCIKHPHQDGLDAREGIEL